MCMCVWVGVGESTDTSVKEKLHATFKDQLHMTLDVISVVFLKSGISVHTAMHGSQLLHRDPGVRMTTEEVRRASFIHSAPHGSLQKALAGTRKDFLVFALGGCSEGAEIHVLFWP